MRGTNSNITRRRLSKWQGAEYDLVEDGGVSIAKGWVVACGP